MRFDFTANYTVTLNQQGGSGGSSSVTATYDAAMPSITVPTRTGYTFGGYYTSTGGGGTQYYNASGTGVRTWDIASETTLYAKWTANKYRVTFGKNGGTGGDDYVTATYGQQMPTPRTAPTKTGYTFGGYWTTTGSGGVQYYDGEMKSVRKWDNPAATTLWAKWTAKQYKVRIGFADAATFRGSSYSAGSYYTYATSDKLLETGAGGGAGILHVPTRTGYTFAGYYDASSGGNIAYDANGKAVSGTYWDAAYPSGKFNGLSSAADTFTVYARWTAKKCTVTLNQQGGSGGSTSVTATYGSAMPSATMPTRTGYTFGGYYTGTNGGGTQYYTASGASARTWNVSSNTTLYAKWTAKTYTVTLDSLGGSGGASSVTATYGQKLPSIADSRPSKSGYYFDGYYAGQNGSGQQYYSAVGASEELWLVDGDATIYAKWSRVVDVSLMTACTENAVSFPVAGVSPRVRIGTGTSGTSASGSQVEGRTVTLSAIANARPSGSSKGITFSHFVVTHGGKTIVNDSSSVMSNGDWKEVTFTVPRDEQGGISATAYYSRDVVTATALLDSAASGEGISSNNIGVTPADVTRYFGDSATFAAGNPSGYVFHSWGTENGPMSGTSSTLANYPVTLTDDITLYAHYARSVSFETTNGGSVAVSFGTDSDSESVSDPTSAFLVPLGTKIRSVASSNDGFYFVGIQFTPTGGAAVDKPYGANDSYAPDGSGKYTVSFMESPPDVYLACLDAIEETTPATTGNVGATTASYGGADNAFTPVEASSVDADIKANFSDAESARWYKVRKGLTVNLATAKSTASSGTILEWKSTKSKSLPLSSGASLMGATPAANEGSGEPWSTMDFPVLGNTLIVTKWGLYANPTITLVPGAGGRAVFVGVAQVDGQDVHEKSFPVSNGVYQTTTVRAIPDPSGGYVFAGWFRNGQLVTTDADYAFTVTADAELVAQFALDDNAVFAWEGGTSNKVMEWTSGVLTVPKPQDPVAVRVDAVQYPVSASVQTRSSPDSEDVRVHAVEVAGQSARRLPRMRPERFWQVSLVSDAEIDAVVVATNIVEAN